MTYKSKKFSMEEPWLSKSSISLYTFCPHAFELRYIRGLDTPPTDQMKRGTLFHTWAEKIYDVIDTTKIINGELSLRDEFEKYKPQIAEEDVYDKFIGIEEERWEVTEDKELFFPIKREIFLADEDLLYFGTFDRIDKIDDDSYVVIDYKTGKFRGYNISNYRFECYGYKHLVEDNYDYNITHMCMIFPDEEHILFERFKKQTADSFYKKVERTRKRILNEEFDKKGYCDVCFMRSICDKEKRKELRKK